MNQLFIKSLLLEACTRNDGMREMYTNSSMDVPAFIASFLTKRTIIQLIASAQQFQFQTSPEGYRLYLLTAYPYICIDFYEQLRGANRAFVYQFKSVSSVPPVEKRVKAQDPATPVMYDFLRVYTTFDDAQPGDCIWSESSYNTFCKEQQRITTEYVQQSGDMLLVNGLHIVMSKRKADAAKYDLNLISESLTCVQLIEYITELEKHHSIDDSMHTLRVLLGFELYRLNWHAALKVFESLKRA
ncbi:MAG: hypothetical protein RSC43_00980 [Clostridia bacterium]